MRTLAAAVAALVAFAVLLVLVATGWGPLHHLDTSVADGLNRYYARHGHQVTFWKAVSTVGQPLTFEVLAVAAALALWLRGRIRTALLVAGGVLGANLLSTLVKIAVGRARPHVATVLTHPHGASFPSGHAITSFAAAAVAVAVIRHRAVWAVVLVPLLVGYSRLALGAHFPSDVAAAWLLALAWVLLLRRYLTPPRG